MLLREIRLDSGESIKAAAPLLNVDYTYLSKIENDVVAPSADLLTRLAAHYGVDVDTLFLAAGRLPPDIEQVVKAHPAEVMKLLRQHFGRGE
jgi:transcriptional regulator with XRE-family HTH domain